MENVLLNAENDSIDTWAYVEIFGHDRLAGRVTTVKLGTQVMIQVDVPKGKDEFSHSELFSPGSIFSIKPTTESYCRQFNINRASFQREVIPYVPEAKSLPASAFQTPDDYDHTDDCLPY